MVRNFLHTSNNPQDGSNVNDIVPLKKYNNAELLKKDIMTDNINKTGIYRWVNNISNNTYVGSAINLSSAIADFRKNNPLSTERLAKLKNDAIKREGVAVSVLNTQTDEVREFTNQTEAGEYLGVTRQAIHSAIVREKPIKDIYIVSKVIKD